MRPSPKLTRTLLALSALTVLMGWLMLSVPSPMRAQARVKQIQARMAQLEGLVVEPAAQSGQSQQLLAEYASLKAELKALAPAMATRPATATAQDPQEAQLRQMYDDDQIFSMLSGAARASLERRFGPKASSPTSADSLTTTPPRRSSLASRHRLQSVPSVFANPLVNNPAVDTTSHDTQSETAIVLGAGSNVIASFNDSGAGAGHVTGFSTSTNSGVSWTDGGDLPASSTGDNGDPVLAQSNSTGTVFLSTIATNLDEHVWVFRSTNNGTSFNTPINGAPGLVNGVDAFDKEWITVDNFAGAGNGNVYLAATNFSSNGARAGITFFRSTNDGVTWGPNQGVLVTGNDTTGSNVVVGMDHAVYVFYYKTDGSLRMRKSIDQGQTFAAETLVFDLTTGGGAGDLGLNGGFRTNAFPQAAVNPVNGNIYVVYNDVGTAGGDRADAYFIQSINGGGAWSAPVKVNDDATTNDQWFPAIAVTPDGTKLCVTFYDRRLDGANNLINRFGSIAAIVGPTVTFGPNFRITNQSFPVVIGVDSFTATDYMGDYDQMAADNNFFYTTWGDNRDASTFSGAMRNNANVRFAIIPAALAADLAITKTDSPDPVIAGTNLTYTLNLINNGPDAATNVTVSDPLPAGTTFVSASVTSGTGWTGPIVLGNVVSFTKASVANQETATFQIVVTVDPCFTDHGTLSDTATVSADPSTPDPDTTNNSSTATTAVNRSADLVFAKTDSPDPVIAGNQLTYTLTSTNNGPSCSANVFIIDTIPTNTRFVSAMASAGATLSTPAVGGSGSVQATWNGDTSPGVVRTLTIVVRVCPEVLCNTIISDTGLTASQLLTSDPNPANNNNNADPDTTLVQTQADLAVSKVGTPNPVPTGQNVTYTLTVSNAGPSNSVNTVLTDVLPKGFTPVLPLPAGCSASPVDPNTGQVTVTCQLGTVGAPNQCATTFPLTVATQIVAMVPEGCKYPTITVTNTATVVSGDCLPDPNLANNTGTFDTLVVPGEGLPGTPVLAAVPVSDQKAGSVLFYNFYTSNATNLSGENTRINITNTSTDDSVVVHFFFVDGSSCTPADAFICLTPSQTLSLLASDIDPGVTGYVVAVATDAKTGMPIAYNCLIGDEFIKLGSGHAANLGAEAISALTFDPAGTTPGLTATLNFDGLSYNQAPRVLAVDNFPSPADGNSTLLILNRVGGNLSSGASNLGALFGVLYDEAEQPLSFTLSSNTCQLRGSLTNSFLRTTQRLETVVSAGRTGWLRLWGVNDIGLLGAVINLNSTPGGNNFSQGHNLHKLTFTTSASLTIPIIVPAC